MDLPAPKSRIAAHGRPAGWTGNPVVRMVVALGVLAAAVLASLQAGWLVHRATSEERQARFIGICDEITARISARLRAYALMLQGGRAHFTASDDVRRDEWKTYYDVLDAKRTVPGYLSVGFIEWVDGPGLDDHVARTRNSDGELSGYLVHPPGERPCYAPVVFIEPFAEENRQACGFDMYSEPVRRTAMQKACDTGEAALTSRVKLVQDRGDGDVPGAVMYVPVFRNGAGIATPEERRKALVGWVFCAFRIDELMAGALPDWHASDRTALGLRIYDGVAPSAPNLLFANRPDERSDDTTVLETMRVIDFYGHRWLIVFTGDERPAAGLLTPAAATTGGGLLISGLLFGLVLTAFKRLDAQRHAEDLAAQVAEMAFHDSLTGLPNRLLLLDRLEMALAGCRRAGGYGALMMVDLDNFKPLNDTNGHAAGDLLLVEVARRLQACVRRTDTVARLGGDEFIVLLAGLTGDAQAARTEASTVAGKILSALARPYPLEFEGATDAAIEHHCSSSIGVTLFSGDDADPSAILKRADSAMYSAKQAGRNRVCINQADAPPADRAT